jgi:hypothetical protein
MNSTDIEWETYVYNSNTYTRCPNKDYVPGSYANPNTAGHWYGYFNTPGMCPDCIRVSEWRNAKNIPPRDSNRVIGSTGKHLVVTDQQINETRNKLHALLQTLQ